MARSGRHPFRAVRRGDLQGPVRRDSPGGDGVPPVDHQFADPARRGRTTASRISELVINRRNTIPTGGISPNRPLEIAAPNCTERMPTRTSHTGERRGVATWLTLRACLGFDQLQ